MNALRDADGRRPDGDRNEDDAGSVPHEAEPRGSRTTDEGHGDDAPTDRRQADLLSRFPQLADRASMNDEQLVQTYDAALQRLKHELDDTEA